MGLHTQIWITDLFILIQSLGNIYLSGRGSWKTASEGGYKPWE